MAGGHLLEQVKVADFNACLGLPRARTQFCSGCGWDIDKHLMCWADYKDRVLYCSKTCAEGELGQCS